MEQDTKHFDEKCEYASQDYENHHHEIFHVGQGVLDRLEFLFQFHQMSSFLMGLGRVCVSAGLSQTDCNVLLSEPAAVWFPSFSNEVSGELKINIETIADLNEMLTGKLCFLPGQE